MKPCRRDAVPGVKGGDLRLRRQARGQPGTPGPEDAGANLREPQTGSRLIGAAQGRKEQAFLLTSVPWRTISSRPLPSIQKPWRTRRCGELRDPVGPMSGAWSLVEEGLALLLSVATQSRRLKAELTLGVAKLLPLFNWRFLRRHRGWRVQTVPPPLPPVCRAPIVQTTFSIKPLCGQVFGFRIRDGG